MVEGGSVYDFYIKEWAGVNPENGKATWYKDVIDEDGRTTGPTVAQAQTEAALYFQGSALHDVYAGITHQFSYNGYDLSLLLSYHIGGKISEGAPPMIMLLRYA